MSLANSLESYTAAITASAINSQLQREVGVVDIEEAIRNVREVFQLKGAQLAAFAKGISRPLMQYVGIALKMIERKRRRC